MTSYTYNAGNLALVWDHDRGTETRYVYDLADRLVRLKESDRIESTLALLRALCVRAKATEDGLIINGGTLSGGTVDSFGDHRIAMSAALASHFATGDITLCGAECVNKSYPRFWEDFASLGGLITLQ